MSRYVIESDDEDDYHEAQRREVDFMKILADVKRRGYKPPEPREPEPTSYLTVDSEPKSAEQLKYEEERHELFGPRIEEARRRQMEGKSNTDPGAVSPRESNEQAEDEEPRGISPKDLALLMKKDIDRHNREPAVGEPSDKRPTQSSEDRRRLLGTTRTDAEIRLYFREEIKIQGGSMRHDLFFSVSSVVAKRKVDHTT